jgi:hypothetical protein
MHFEGVTYTRAQHTQNTDHGETISKVTAYRYIPYLYTIDINSPELQMTLLHTSLCTRLSHELICLSSLHLHRLS